MFGLLLFKSFCIFVNSTWPRGAIDGQLSLTWPRSAIAFSFANFWSEILFLGKFGPKSQNYQLKLKFGTYTNSNMQNSMVMFIFFVFDLIYPFWAIFVQNIKILTLSWNLVPTLIRACIIQWWCSFFLFLIGNTLFGQIWSKKSKLSV